MAWPRAETIESPRLILEPLAVAHAGEMAVVLADPELYEFTGGGAPSAHELERRYAAQVAGQSADGSPGWLNWVIRRRPGSEAVGYVQATVEEHEGRWVAEVAWVVGVRSQGDGVATEAVRAMLGRLRLRGVSGFSALVHPGHTASRRVAAACGFIPTSEVVAGETRWTAS